MEKKSLDRVDLLAREIRMKNDPDFSFQSLSERHSNVAYLFIILAVAIVFIALYWIAR